MTIGPYSGGSQITNLEWVDVFALRVDFETTYDNLIHQVYIGRSLAGNTESMADLSLICHAIPSIYPEHIQLLAVDPADRYTDFGAILPDRPYNAVKLAWTTSGWAPDTRRIEIAAGTEAGGSVVTSNVIGKVPFDDDGAFQFLTDPLPGSGEWNFQIAGRDKTKPNGNRGIPLAISADILAHPPDLARQPDGYNRLAVTITGGNLTASFVEADI